MTRNRVWQPLLAWTLGVGTFLLLGSKCPVHAVTGLYCPGCGSVRAIEALAMGNVGDALQNNIVTVTILPFVVAGILWPRSPIGTMFARYPRAVGGVAAVVMFTFTVARNTVAPWLSPVS